MGPLTGAFFWRVNLNQSKRAFFTSSSFPDLFRFTPLTDDAAAAARMVASFFIKPCNNPLLTPSRSARRRRRRLKGIQSRSDTNRTGAESLSFYYPRLLYCLDQVLAVMSLSQHRVSSSKTVRPHAPCGAQCIGHTVSTWSAVCSEAPHSQFGEEARPHLCMDEWNRLTPVRRRLSLTQAARGKPIPTGLEPVSGTKARSLEAPSQYSAFHL